MGPAILSTVGNWMSETNAAPRPSAAPVLPGDVDERVTALRARLDTLPRVRLAHLPTPLDACENLSRSLGVELFLKRDDCTGLAFGGNKGRQLEFILGDARAQGADCVIQGAASQSNHARQLAAAGAKLGLSVHLLPKRDARSDPVQGNLLVASLLGADVRMVSPDQGMQQAKEALAEELRAEGAHPYIVGMGAQRTLALAAVAYVGALLEIVEWFASQGEEPPQWIYTTSQGGTQAGLLLGARLLGLDTRIVGVNPMRSDHEAYIAPEEIADLANAAAAMVDLDAGVTSGDIDNTTDYVGEQYGVPSAAGAEALERLASAEGVLLDPVYTAKGFSGLLDHVRGGRISPGERVTFVHTGGTPALFAYAPELLSEGELQ